MYFSDSKICLEPFLLINDFHFQQTQNSQTFSRLTMNVLQSTVCQKFKASQTNCQKCIDITAFVWSSNHDERCNFVYYFIVTVFILMVTFFLFYDYTPRSYAYEWKVWQEKSNNSAALLYQQLKHQYLVVLVISLFWLATYPSLLNNCLVPSIHKSIFI